MKIQQINTSDGDLEQRLEELRGRLSLSGDVVSEKGRQRTIQIFGEPLAPRKVVQRICQDVHQEGIVAVLRYTEQLDNAQLTPATLRVPAADLAAAHRAADPAFLNTIRRIRENISEFQAAGKVSAAIHPYAAAAGLASILERLAAYHQELEASGVTRDDLIETCARMLVQTVTGRTPR